MPRLRIGVDTSGAEKVAKLAKDLDLLAKSSDAAAKGTEKTNTAYKTLAQGINAISGKFSKLNKEFDDVQRAANLAAGGIVAFNNALTGAGSGSKLGSGLKQVVGDMQALSAAAGVARTEMYALMETSGQYATIAKKNAGATYEQNVAMRAQLLATQQLYGLEERYVAAKAKQILMDEAGAQALVAKTKAINANAAAYERLAVAGKVKGGFDRNTDYSWVEADDAARIAAEKKVEASRQESLRLLEAQFARRKAIQANEAAEAAASAAAQVAAEKKVEASRQESLRLLEAQFAHRKTIWASETAAAEAAAAAQAAAAAKAAAAFAKSAPNRASLGLGDRGGSAGYASQVNAESSLYDDKGKLKYSITNMKEYEAAMKQAATGTAEFSTKTGLAHATLEKFGLVSDKAAKSSRTLHDALRGASGAAGSLWMTYGSFVPLMTGFAAVAGTIATVTKGADFDYAARSIEILTYGYTALSENADLATTSLEGTKAAILAITNTPFTPGQLSEGVLEFSRAGYKDLEQNIKNVDQASKFAYIGQMDLSKAVETVVGQMSAFKDIGEDAGPALNTMAVVADKTSINLQQMAEAFKNTTSLGTVMGMKFNDIAVALGVMGQAGIRGATAGAALNTMMYKLIAPTATAQKKMAELGVEFDAFDKKTGAIKSVKEIAFELANLTKNLNPNQTAAVFESMVGLRGVKALGALVQMAKSSAKEFDDLSKAVAGSGTYLDGYFKMLEGSGKFQIDLLKAEFDKLFTANYDNASVVTAIKGLREVITSPGFANALAAITTSMLAFVTVVAKFIALDFTAVIAAMGTLATLYAAQATAAATAAAATTGLGVAIATVAGPVAIALGALLKIKEFYDWWNASNSNKIDFAAGVTGQFGGEDPFTDEMRAQIKEMDEFEKKAKSAAKAKNELAVLAGVQLSKPVTSVEDSDKLAKIDDYFNRIQDKIIDINRTPLQIVNKQIQDDVAEMWSTLASGGATLEEQAKVSAGYVRELEKLTTESQSAEAQISRLKRELGDTKDEGAKKWIQEIIDNLTKLATAAKQKDIAKAQKEMLAGMRKEWQSYADKVIELQDKIAGRQRTLAEDLRSIDQSNMDGLTLWRDKKKEAEEYAAAAKKAGAESLAAFAKGDSVTGQSQFALAEDQMKKAVEAAKALNTEVKNSAGQTLLTKPQGAEEAKKFLKEFAAEQIKLDKAVQDAYKGQMDGIQGKAGGADMTEGMDAAKARWITNWMDMKTASTQNMASAADEIQTKMDTINFPTQRWRESIFNMKGMFVEAADEMSRRLEAEGNYSGTGKRATNAQPTSKYVEELKKIEAEVEAARDKASKPIDTQVQVNAVDAAAAMGQAIKQGGAAAAVEISKAQTSAIATAKVTTPVVQKGTGLMTGFGGGLEPERIAAINTQLADTARYVSLLANSGASLEGALDIPQVQKEVDVFKAELERARAAYEAVQNSINNAPEGQYSLDQKLEVANTLDSLQQAQLEIVKIQETVKAAAPLSKYLDSEAAATEAEALQTAIKDIVDAFSATGIDLGITKDIEEVKETSTDMLKVWKEGWEGTSDYAVERVDYIHDALKDLVNKDWTVKVNVEEARHLGGMLGGYHNGGVIQALAAGGGVKNVLQGAYLPGFGGGDRRLLLGEDGEVMLNKFAVAKGTPQTALAYNRGDFRTVVNDLVTRFPGLLPGYAGGGMMGESPSPAAVDASNAQTPGYSASFTFTDTSGQQGKVFGSETDIKLLERAINKHNRFRSSNK